jgi:hypothetical protein
MGAPESPDKNRDFGRQVSIRGRKVVLCNDNGRHINASMAVMRYGMVRVGSSAVRSYYLDVFTIDL